MLKDYVTQGGALMWVLAGIFLAVLFLAVFTTLGFAGLYMVLGIVYLGLVAAEVKKGPRESTEGGH